MIAVLFGSVVPVRRKGGGAGEGWRGRWQDTSRTPFCRKAEAFPWLHMGASVGERAARKEKAKDFNAPNGTNGYFRREAHWQ